MSAEEREIDKGTWRRRQFVAFGAFGLFGALIWGVRRWIMNAPESDGTAGPLRRMLAFNERVNRTYRSDARLAKEFPKEMAVRDVRVNGRYGITRPVNVESWRLAVIRDHPVPGTVLKLDMDALRALPRTELVFDFKCIEGWSQVSHWGGVRFSDLAEHFGLGTRSGASPDPSKPGDLYRYLSLRTPDGAYYVGIDMPSALHPQTILAYEMNGAPLTPEHGAPLRLIIPTKYGVKSLKRIGLMAFSDGPPPDYWHERGYDYDCAL